MNTLDELNALPIGARLVKITELQRAIHDALLALVHDASPAGQITLRLAVAYAEDVLYILEAFQWPQQAHGSTAQLQAFVEDDEVQS